MVSANNTLAALSESLGSNTIGSHYRKQGQDLREQYGWGSGELRVHSLGKAEVERGAGVGGERDTTVTINVLGTFQMAQASKKNGGGGLGLTSMTQSAIQPPAWTQLLFPRLSRQQTVPRTYL